MSKRISAIDALGLRMNGYPQHNASYYWILSGTHQFKLYKRELIPDIEKLTHHDCAAPTEAEVILWKLSTTPEKDVHNMTVDECFKYMTRYRNPFKDPNK